MVEIAGDLHYSTRSRLPYGDVSNNYFCISCLKQQLLSHHFFMSTILYQLSLILCLGVSHKTVIKVSVKAKVSSGSSTGEGSSSTPCYVIVGQIQFCVSYWTEDFSRWLLVRRLFQVLAMWTYQHDNLFQQN